jgi:hypothetical protein
MNKVNRVKGMSMQSSMEINVEMITLSGKMLTQESFFN